MKGPSDYIGYMAFQEVMFSAYSWEYIGCRYAHRVLEKNSFNISIENKAERKLQTLALEIPLI